MKKIVLNYLKNKKKFKTIILLIGLVVYNFSVMAQTWPPSDMNGSGISSSPWQITTAAHLEQLAIYVNAGYGNNTNGKYYQLNAEIDLRIYSAWNPIGVYVSSEDSTKSFQGNFDGNNKTILSGRSLFGCVYGATIENFGIGACDLIGIGGLIEWSVNSSIVNCHVTGNITGNSWSAGGLIGRIANSFISNCYSTANVSGGQAIGGLVGAGDSGYSSSNISNCYATGNVWGGSRVGGLVGDGYRLTISNCYATGTVRGGDDQGTGGLVGTRANISNCVAANDSIICTANTTQINRIAGRTDGTYYNNYALNGIIIQSNGTSISIIDDMNTISGFGKDVNTLQSLAFYNTSENWYNNIPWNIGSSTSTWSICENIWLPFLSWQEVDCNNISVSNITNLPTIVTAGEPLVLTGIIEPSYATNQNILWSVSDTGTTNATISGNTLNATAAGTVTITATITNGIAVGMDYTQNFDIIVTAGFDLIFNEGNGSIEAPYKIFTAVQLKSLADYVNLGLGYLTSGKHFKLMNNIDLNEYISGDGWEPMGGVDSENAAFYGNFDGNGKTIQHLTINRPSEGFIGLFGRVINAQIENIVIENCNIIGSDEVAALTGLAENSTISNCYATGNVSGRDGGFYAGGIASVVLTSTVSDCYVAVNVNGGRYTGGLIGAISDSSTVTNSYASGNVVGYDFVGGLVGINGISIYPSQIRNCTITNCIATSTVKGGNNRVGGLVGSNRGTIINCIAANDTVLTITDIIEINRISGENYDNWIAQNNYALNIMIIENENGILTITDGSDEAGISKDMSTLKTLVFYSTAENWHNNEAWDIVENTAVWDICNNKTLPWLRWQEIDCNTESIPEDVLSNIMIYPNPTQNSFIVDIEGTVSVKLYDMLGKEVLSQNANGKTEINISHLPNGIYNVRVISKEGFIGISKIVKQN